MKKKTKKLTASTPPCWTNCGGGEYPTTPTNCQNSTQGTACASAHTFDTCSGPAEKGNKECEKTLTDRNWPSPAANLCGFIDTSDSTKIIGWGAWDVLKLDTCHYDCCGVCVKLKALDRGDKNITAYVTMIDSMNPTTPATVGNNNIDLAYEIYNKFSPTDLGGICMSYEVVDSDNCKSTIATSNHGTDGQQSCDISKNCCKKN